MRLQCRRPWFDSWIGKIPWRRDRLLLQYSWASLVVEIVRNSLPMLETGLQSLCGKDLLEKGMTTHSSILAWRTPWKMEPAGLQSMGMQRVGHNWATFTHSLTHSRHGREWFKYIKLGGKQNPRPASLLAQMAAEVAWCLKLKLSGHFQIETEYVILSAI